MPSSFAKNKYSHEKIIDGIIFTAILFLAAWLRLESINHQWLTDDEWHALHIVQKNISYLDILQSVGIADFSIPQTIYYKFLANTPIGLSELGMRLPMLLGGLSLVILGTVWAKKHISTEAGNCLGLLLAISPLLVNYSRNARPYILTLLLAWIAIIALLRWRESRQYRWLFVNSAATIFACWLHMAAAPFILPPTAFIIATVLIKSFIQRNKKEALIASLYSLLLICGIGFLCLRPLWLSRDILASRVGADLPTADTFIGVWYIFLGTGNSIVVIIGVALGILGLWSVRHSQKQLLTFAAIGIAGLLASIYFMKPSWVQNPLTFARYMLPAQILLLVGIATGITFIMRDTCKPMALRQILTFGMCSIFMVGTPYDSLLTAPNNFTLHSWYQFDYREKKNPIRIGFPQFQPSAFWNQFTNAPLGSLHFAVPGHSFESFTSLDVMWQPIHRQWVLTAQLSNYCMPSRLPGEAFNNEGIHLKNAVDISDADDMQQKRIDYLVFYKNRAYDMKSCILKFQQQGNHAVFEDADIVAFKTSTLTK